MAAASHRNASCPSRSLFESYSKTQRKDKQPVAASERKRERLGLEQDLNGFISGQRHYLAEHRRERESESKAQFLDVPGLSS